MKKQRVREKETETGSKKTRGEECSIQMIRAISADHRAACLQTAMLWQPKVSDLAAWGDYNWAAFSWLLLAFCLKKDGLEGEMWGNHHTGQAAQSHLKNRTVLPFGKAESETLGDKFWGCSVQTALGSCENWCGMHGRDLIDSSVWFANSCKNIF